MFLSISVFLSPLPLTPVVRHAFAGIIISTISHLLAVIVLFFITLNLLPARVPRKQYVAFTAACLHIISPAGIFLSAPYAESPFALFNFVGILSYTYAAQCRNDNQKTVQSVCWTVAAGASFGIATMMRSNGLLSGTAFAWDALMSLSQATTSLNTSHGIARFMATVLAGMLVAVGFAAPQAVAYIQYCTGNNTRPWCTRVPPSIYSWVQEHYWEVGFMKYWTLNNLPLFLLAAPMLVVLVYTGYLGLMKPESLLSLLTRDNERTKLPAKKWTIFSHVIPRIALPQLVLAAMATTSFHVQIVNRISSGYPLCYIVLAIATSAATQTSSKNAEARTNTTPSQNGVRGPFTVLSKTRLQWIVRSMAMYAIVQGGLYASFLPPA